MLWFLQCGARQPNCQNVSSELAILAALPESPAKLNTNVEHRDFGVKRPQFFFCNYFLISACRSAHAERKTIL
jgi:hypothetical protein